MSLATCLSISCCCIPTHLPPEHAYHVITGPFGCDGCHESHSRTHSSLVRRVCRAFLQSKGVNSYRSGIVQCIAEKCNILMPGIYDDTLYPKDT